MACAAGVCRATRRVFVTSVIYPANMGGVAGADMNCQTRATAAGLMGTFRAWLSDRTSNAATRLTHSTVPYVLLDGSMVANDWADLTDGTIARPINMTETRGAPPMAMPVILGEPTVWTGSTAMGTATPSTDHCNDWTDVGTSSHQMTEGRSDLATMAWSNSRTWSGGPCTWQRPLFCFEQ